jgi:uncharacterized protein (TIGR02246 family)
MHKDPIRALIDRIDRAHRDKDAAAIAACYAPDAPIFDLAPPLGHRGIDAGQLAGWFKGWKGPVERDSRRLTIEVHGDVAVATGYIQVRAVTQDGQDAAWWMRATTLFRRDGGEWRIVHEHTSVPFHMDGSFRAAVDLEPPKE